MQIDLLAFTLDVVRAGSLPSLAQTLVAGLAIPRSVALARVWFRDLATGQLTLAGSAGTPSGGGSYSRLDGEFSEFAVSDAKIRDVATSRSDFVVRGIRGDEEWLTSTSWAARQGVRAFLALPMLVDDVMEGVAALFDREIPTDASIADLQFVTAVTAARLDDLRTRGVGSLSAGASAFLTRAELRRIEKQNIESALVHSGGKVFGPSGAAVLLGVKPTTLASRIKALGVLRREI